MVGMGTACKLDSGDLALELFALPYQKDLGSNVVSVLVFM